MSAAASTGKPSNVYIHRQAGTPKPCLVCYRQSLHVLVSQSVPSLDFFYVCLTHLGDRHFATRLSKPETLQTRLPDKVSQSEIDKVKAQYEARLKAKEKEKEAGSSSMTGAVFSTLTSAVSSVSQAAVATVKPSTPTPPPPAADSYPLHARYTLHREFYAMRIREWNNKQFKKKEKELNMPRAPSGLI